MLIFKNEKLRNAHLSLSEHFLKEITKKILDSPYLNLN